MFYILVALSVILVARFIYLRGSIADQADRYHIPFSYEEMESEWSKLSFAGTNPLRVVILASEMCFYMSVYKADVHMTSAYYSQVKFLVRKGYLVTALVFFLESRAYAKKALKEYSTAPEEEKSPINLEVLGAPDFMLANIPIIGFVWKKKALSFLFAAHKSLEQIFAQSARVEPITAALIWSKIFALTRDDVYKNRVRNDVRLTGHEDKGQLTRVMKHLGFTSLDQLYEFCNI